MKRMPTREGFCNFLPRAQECGRVSVYLGPNKHHNNNITGVVGPMCVWTHPHNTKNRMENKNEFLTPEEIAERIKAIGLQRLRWYCQMCQKQCRDEKGFKRHCMSVSHQQLENAFLDLMRASHGHSRVSAAVVYHEYIHDPHHVDMNSTQWATLSEFVKYLGWTGKCKVDETPRGWFITYVDRD
ncbi:DNA/RNA-binding protein kin17 [Turnera subulata]|uniref:DNA/RNA-binding protein kin17 n=1 Tax=Turnera subulata TaxID=218843 RepID=A0A9Q0FXL6_9ROSI|nr:DNA/RNA-binding protein kin17 [Turnera subulata]